MELRLGNIENYDSYQDSDMSVIGADIVLRGDIEAGNNLTVLGTITGDVNITGNLEVSGAITGNLSSRSFHSDCAKITGNIMAEASIVVGPDAVILGNINGADVEITGAVKGDIDARGSIHLGHTAVIKGNLKSRSMMVEDGAVIAGQCEQCYAEKTADRFFKELEDGVVNMPPAMDDIPDMELPGESGEQVPDLKLVQPMKKQDMAEESSVKDDSDLMDFEKLSDYSFGAEPSEMPAEG